MSKEVMQILEKLKTSIDSDDVLDLASFLELNISKSEELELKKMLKEYISQEKLSIDELLAIKQLLGFLD